MHILVVDDNQNLLNTLQDVLKSYGHTVAIAMNGIAAYHLVKRDGSFEAIITDMQMPCGSGLDFVELLHGDGYTIPCRLQSGNDFYVKDGHRIDLGDALKPYPFATFASRSDFGHIHRFLDEIEK